MEGGRKRLAFRGEVFCHVLYNKITDDVSCKDLAAEFARLADRGGSPNGVFLT